MATKWTVSGFLGERELLSDQRDARSFYEHLKREFKSLPRYQHSRMGVGKPGGSSSKDEKVCFFRGQACSEWGLTSSLYRLLDATDNLGVDSESEMADAERGVISAARSPHIGIGRGVSPLELLAVLQHHGVPTRLIDMSTDWRVALYFACNELDSEDGRLFFIFVDQDSRTPALLDSEKNVELNWWQGAENAFNESVWRSSVFPVLFPFFDVRMISQRGYFIVGGLPENGAHLGVSCDGVGPRDVRNVSSLSIQFPKLEYRDQWGKVFKGVARSPRASAMTLRIPAEFKPGIRRMLWKDGVFRDSLYPPLMESVRLLKDRAATFLDERSLFD